MKAGTIFYFFIFLSRGHLVRGHFLWVPTLDFLAGWQLATGTESFIKGVPTKAKLLNEKTSQNKKFVTYVFSDQVSVSIRII